MFTRLNRAKKHISQKFPMKKFIEKHETDIYVENKKSLILVEPNSKIGFRVNIMDKEKIIKLAVRRLIESGDFDIVEKVFSINYIAHAGDKDYKGHDFVKKFTKQIRSAIPDIKVKSIEFLSKSGNTITWQRTFSGTHKKNMKGIPPSDKKIKWRDMVVSRFEGETISEEWIISELMGELLLKTPGKKKGRLNE